MQSDKKKRVGYWVIGVALACLLLFYINSLKIQIRETNVSQGHDEKEIQQLSTVQNSQALEANREFLEKFFTYKSTADRYKAIKPMMTDEGFKAAHPSGMVLNHTKESVKSSMFGLKPFEYQATKREAEFFNEFKLTTDYQGVSNTDTNIVKTSLLYIDKEGWKVDDVQFVGQLTGE
jgi:hypothetical protein